MVAWLLAQLSKPLISYPRHRRFVWELLLSAGGMPSSHSAFVCAIAMAIALSEGLSSPIFALAVGVAAVVMYDAAGVRRAAGHHATLLNQIVAELFQGHPISDAKLKELLGHTPFQVLLGAILGLLSTWVGMRFVWSG
ncbi:MAG: divergent PAP2 family protein [Anaerolineae bacterium]|nr:divergent PAP2 family protein [Anaerolineae bacterium]